MRDHRPLGAIEKAQGEKRYHIESYGEVALTNSVWNDLDAKTVENTVAKMRVGQKERIRFTGSFNLGRVEVRRVQ